MNNGSPETDFDSLRSILEAASSPVSTGLSGGSQLGGAGGGTGTLGVQSPGSSHYLSIAKGIWTMMMIDETISSALAL